MHYPKPLQKIVGLLKKLPGVGGKSAERIAFHLLQWEDSQLEDLGQRLLNIKKSVTFCQECGAIKDEEKCLFCSPERNQSSLCILASSRDLFFIEQTKSYHGLYHVIDSLLSPIEGKELQENDLQKIKERIEKGSIKEVILAFDSTLEGDATALFLKKALSSYQVKIFRLAFGLPVGSSFEYIDAHTLSRAIAGKQTF